MENYLKAVFTLRQTHGRVRCIHIAERMDVTLPSVSRAVKDGSVTLTPSGERIAAEIYERHRFFTQRLIAAGVDPETAAKEACHMEHGVSENSFEKLKQSMERQDKKVH
jgi:Mn-dependent DtxR family transcriptional regulator